MTMRSKEFRFSITCLIAIAVIGAANAENWPRFRGSNGTGVAPDSNIPTEWTQDDLTWKIQLPGDGNASPVVWGDTVYITSADRDSGTFSLHALRASDGEVEWKRDYTFEPIRVHNLNSFASSTPAVDENGVYTMSFGKDQSLVIALDHTGEEMWTKEFGTSSTMHGPSQSPMLYNGMLIFSLEQEINRKGLQSYWYALDGKTGETVWRLDRDTSAKASSSAPCVYQTEGGKDWLVFSSFAHGVTAVDPETGMVVWEEKDAMTARVISSPVIAGEYIISTCGRRGGGLQLLVVQPNGGEGTKPRIIHNIEERFVPYVPTSVASGDLLYTFHDAGTISCMAVKTGEVIWSERVRAKFFGSPVLVGDKLYCISDSGEVFVLRAGTKFDQLAVNDLGEGSHATPAVANGRMFLRTNTQLMCVAAPL